MSDSVDVKFLFSAGLPSIQFLAVSGQLLFYNFILVASLPSVACLGKLDIDLGEYWSAVEGANTILLATYFDIMSEFAWLLLTVMIPSPIFGAMF